MPHVPRAGIMIVGVPALRMRLLGPCDTTRAKPRRKKTEQAFDVIERKKKMSNLTKGTTLHSFEQLEDGLRTWTSFVDTQVYDQVGMMALLCACVQNLLSNVPPAAWDDLGSILSEDERAFLKAIAESR